LSTKYIYLFSEGNGSMKELLGGKGANLAEMNSLGMPVPPGFTISTEACTRYYDDGKIISQEILSDLLIYMTKLETATGKRFGSRHNPLLVSVRSGARASMPGMMDTILNLGLNDRVVEGLIELTDNSRFAYDSYRRFIQMFSDVVMELPKSNFEAIINEMKKERGISLDTEFTAEDLREMVIKFKGYYKEKKGTDFPEDPEEQLIEAVKAVFRSWDNPRAVYYRRLNDIPSSWGTAVTVQSMVFGNMGDDSGTGVAFSRNPSTGEARLYGEFLMNAQGEDVVAGIRTPQSIDRLKEVMPEVYAQFTRIVYILEDHYHNMQDMEFTIERGRLYMLQTRNGKRTATAALKIACDLVDENKITPEEAIMMLDPKTLDSLLHPTFETKALAKATPIATGLAASPGAASGIVMFNAQEVQAATAEGKKSILVRLETSPEDIEGMHLAEGILTARGGMTSHAAVVARGMGACCVSGCKEIEINEEEGFFIAGDLRVNRGDYISLDGSTGHVYLGEIVTEESGISGDFARLMGWADSIRQLKVRSNADNPKDAMQSVKLGAEGIGLCRTEHMFFDAERIGSMREMIVSSTEEQRKAALAKLMPMQKQDFIGIYEALEGKPVTVRFLDPPLHEFLPSDDEGIELLAKEMGIEFNDLKQIVINLHEVNPMLGHRGCRLAISYPEIAEMQTEALIEAAIEVKKSHPEWVDFCPEIMIPLVNEPKELKNIKAVVTATANKVIAAAGIELVYKFGTMIELPRACVVADDIAKDAEFFSFGTNDLTQMTFGLSRDDSGKFLDKYYERQIYESDPFARLDQDGVGKLISMACELGRKTRPDIKLGVCGEHGADPSSIEFCHKMGLEYVSCSPFRVPIARLAAAQAAIKSPRAEAKDDDVTE
jgi:pyruvate, phosphate dikinase